MSTREVGIFVLIWVAAMAIVFGVIPDTPSWWLAVIVMSAAAVVSLPVARVLDRRLFSKHT